MNDICYICGADYKDCPEHEEVPPTSYIIKEWIKKKEDKLRPKVLCKTCNKIYCVYSSHCSGRDEYDFAQWEFLQEIKQVINPS